MAETSESTEIHRGLKGVHFDRSRVCFIDGRAGELRYRGYSIHDLAEHSTFEETCYLLLHGELPTQAELARRLAPADDPLRVVRRADHGAAPEVAQRAIAHGGTTEAAAKGRFSRHAFVTTVKGSDPAADPGVAA